MKYCPSCKRVFDEDDKCPFCENKEIRNPIGEDNVLVLTADPEAASMIIEKFNEAALEFETVAIERLGDSPFSGKAFIPDSEIYVSYKDYEKADLIINEVFKEIEVLNAPPTSKSVFSQVISIALFILGVSAAVFLADLIVALFK